MVNQCSSCSYATMCPNRELYQKIYQCHEEVMVKIADEDTGIIDLRQDATLHIEHRYLDGPGLEYLYHELGLSAPKMCCTLPFNRCVTRDRHPYDQDLLCMAKDPNYSYIKDYDGSKTLWSCKSCYNYREPFEPTDYSNLGGTMFSTFHINDVETKVGETVDLKFIEPPKNIIPGYTRTFSLGEMSHLMKKTNETVICYYYYTQAVRTVPMDSYMTEDQITEKGLRRKVELFYNELSYVYPSLKSGESGITMNVFLDGAIAGIGRVDSNGNVITGPGGIIRFDKEKMEPNVIRTMFGEELVTKRGELIRSSEGYLYSYIGKAGVGGIDALTDFNNSPNQESIDISKGNYRACNLVQGDTLLLRVELDVNYMLNIPLMVSMCFPTNVTHTYQTRIVSNKYGSKRVYYISLVVPEFDIDYQMILVETKKFIDTATYPPIEYLDSWDSKYLAWAAKEVTVMNENVPMKAYPPIAPRMWSKAIMPYDETPAYESDCPSEDDVIRPFFRLFGYTTNLDGRYRHNPNIEILSAMQTGYTSKIHFFGSNVRGLSSNPTFKEYGAMWKPHYSLIETYVTGSMERSEVTPASATDEGMLPVLMSDYINSRVPAEAGKNTMIEMLDAIYGTMNLEYSDDVNAKIKTVIGKLIPNGEFVWNAYLCPQEAKSVRLSNGMLDTDDDSIMPPDGVIEIPHIDGPSTYKNLSECEISDKTLIVGADNFVIVNFYPDKSYGLSPRYQNFVSIVLRISLKPRPTDVTVNLYPGTNSCDVANITNADIRSFSFSNVAPSDIGVLSATFDEVTHAVSLTGPAAHKYEISGVNYKRTIACRVTRRVLDNKDPDVVTEEVLEVNDSKSFLMVPSDNHQITKLTVNGKVPFDVDMNGEPVYGQLKPFDETHKMMVLMTETWAYSLLMDCVSIDMDIEVLVEEDRIVHPDEEFCRRCRGYVDLNDPKYEWIKMYPNCTDYSPNC